MGLITPCQVPARHIQQHGIATNDGTDRRLDSDPFFCTVEFLQRQKTSARIEYAYRNEGGLLSVSDTEQGRGFVMGSSTVNGPSNGQDVKSTWENYELQKKIGSITDRVNNGLASTNPRLVANATAP